jgi:regulation of enolase protein 1 (concanavalin A-like superfamily)
VTRRASYEQAGLIWHADDANYVKVMLERFEGKLVFNFVREEADQPKIVAMAPTDAGSVSIRLVVRGGKYEAQSRAAEAKEWITIRHLRSAFQLAGSGRARHDAGACR